MKTCILLIVVVYLFISCESSNPTAGNDVENDVIVYLYLSKSGSATKIYCEGQIVSYLQYQNERDTINVPENSELKARIYDGGDFVYKTEVAVNNLLWELPDG